MHGSLPILLFVSPYLDLSHSLQTVFTSYLWSLVFYVYVFVNLAGMYPSCKRQGMIGSGRAHVSEVCDLARANLADGIPSAALESFSSLGAGGRYSSNQERDLHKWLHSLFGLQLTTYKVKMFLNVSHSGFSIFVLIVGFKWVSIFPLHNRRGALHLFVLDLLTTGSFGREASWGRCPVSSSPRSDTRFVQCWATAGFGFGKLYTDKCILYVYIYLHIWTYIYIYV